jgi:hypothetical protein
MNKYQMSAIIGYWRCGVDDATIAAIMKVKLWVVFHTIKTYKHIIEG